MSENGKLVLAQWRSDWSGFRDSVDSVLSGDGDD
jgi:hypothetical protein